MFIGPFEHHSNILPWRESCAEVVQIAEDATGGLDMEDLKRNLKLYSRRCLLIGEQHMQSRTVGSPQVLVDIRHSNHKNGDKPVCGGSIWHGHTYDTTFVRNAGMTLWMLACDVEWSRFF